MHWASRATRSVSSAASVSRRNSAAAASSSRYPAGCSRCHTGSSLITASASSASLELTEHVAQQPGLDRLELQPDPPAPLSVTSIGP